VWNGDLVLRPANKEFVHQSVTITLCPSVKLNKPSSPYLRLLNMLPTSYGKFCSQNLISHLVLVVGCLLLCPHPLMLVALETKLNRLLRQHLLKPS